MICCFPTVYSDELLYSWLARYYTRTGYIAYTYVAEELFTSKTGRPDVEFINTLTQDAVRMVTQSMSMEDVVLKHTMFPYYGRFLPLERRRRAFQAMVSMTGNYHNLLPVSTRKNSPPRYLRYCPLCAHEDREKYGETYWHRIHQIIGMSTCPIHRCYLMNSSILIGKKSPPVLRVAEEAVPVSEAGTAASEIECCLSTYMSEVFQSEVDLQSEIRVGEYLHSKLAGTKYVSVRGEQRNIKLLYEDFVRYYEILPENHFTELWQIQKVLTNDRVNFNEICMLAMFLNVLPQELIKMKLPGKTQQQIFDEKVYRLHEEGLKYPEIAKRLNASYDMVKAIGERRYGTCHQITKPPKKSGTKPYDWKQIDEDTLPLVREAIHQLQGDGTTRPKRVTVYTVEKLLNLPSKRITLYLPRCRAEIQKHEESQEQYWAREVTWAICHIQEAGEPVTWRRIRDLTNMRRGDFESCIPHMDTCTVKLTSVYSQ